MPEQIAAMEAGQGAAHLMLAFLALPFLLPLLSQTLFSHTPVLRAVVVVVGGFEGREGTAVSQMLPCEPNVIFNCHKVFPIFREPLVSVVSWL